VGAENGVLSRVITLNPRVLTHNLRQEVRGYQTEGGLEGSGTRIAEAAQTADQGGIGKLGLGAIKEGIE
jgi:hypothetical protein